METKTEEKLAPPETEIIYSCVWNEDSKISFCGKGPRGYTGTHPNWKDYPPCKECHWKAKQMGFFRLPGKDGWYQYV